jgi:hypothetical protein
MATEAPLHLEAAATPAEVELEAEALPCLAAFAAEAEANSAAAAARAAAFDTREPAGVVEAVAADMPEEEAVGAAAAPGKWVAAVRADFALPAHRKPDRIPRHPASLFHICHRT